MQIRPAFDIDLHLLAVQYIDIIIRKGPKICDLNVLIDNRSGAGGGVNVGDFDIGVRIAAI